MGQQPITVVCCEWNNYLGRGTEYVARLKAMVARHLQAPHVFVCLTDDPVRHPGIETHALPMNPPCAWAMTGWWTKLYLFSPARWDTEARLLYLDLDSVVVGPLDELVRHKGAVHLADWGWKRNVHAGGCLLWDALEGGRIWRAWNDDVPKQWENDQEWMTSLGVWSRLPPEIVRSYRYHCKGGVPDKCSIVAFHGKPKPHEITEGWVPEHWRM